MIYRVQVINPRVSLVSIEVVVHDTDWLYLLASEVQETHDIWSIRETKMGQKSSSDSAKLFGALAGGLVLSLQQQRKIV